MNACCIGLILVAATLTALTTEPFPWAGFTGGVFAGIGLAGLYYEDRLQALADFVVDSLIDMQKERAPQDIDRPAGSDTGRSSSGN